MIDRPLATARAEADKLPAIDEGMTKNPKTRETIGWREWLALPDLGVSAIKAKVDTGARTSSLHAFDIERFRRGDQEMVRFSIHPEQRSSEGSRSVEAPLVDRRHVKPSSGETELRLVVETSIELLGQRWLVELTLTRRDAMGFRMLLGRQALRGRFVVDPARSYLNGRRVTKKKRKKKKKKRREQ